MTNNSLNTREQPVSGGILWSSFPKGNTWNIMYVSLATSYTQRPVPALTHINLATEKVLCSHVCPLLCFGVHWFMSSHGKPECRSCKQDSKRKREDMCLWVDLINWESQKHRVFFSAFFTFPFFCLLVSFIFPETVEFSPNFQWNSHSYTLGKIPKELL